MTEEQKRLLKSLRVISPDKFNNKLDDHDKLACGIAVFNEYVKKVAIPKGWDFTKTLKEWPTGEIGEEEFNLFQEVLGYPDFIRYAMEEYRLLIDNDRDTFGPDKPVLQMTKVSRAEARSFVRVLLKGIRESKSISQKWDETEQHEDAIFQMIDRLDELTREQKLNLIMYIVQEYARKKGIPTSFWERSRDFDIHLEELKKENMRILKEASKDPADLFMFGMLYYGVALTQTRDMFFIEKIPEDILHRLLESLESGKELTDEDLKQFKEKMDETDKDKGKK